MHVLYLNPSGQMGGAEVALLDMMASVRTAEPDWKLSLIVAAEGPLAAKAKALGVFTAVLPFSRSLARLGDAAAGGPAGSASTQFGLLFRLLFAGSATAAYVRRLRNSIRDLNPEVIHTNGFKMHILGALAKPAQVPLIWHIHDFLSKRPFMARLVRLFQKRCSVVLANSNSVKADIENVLDDSVKRAVGRPGRLEVQTLYNAVDTTMFSQDGSRLDLDKLSGLPPIADTPSSFVRIGLLATFARWKGHEIFLRALSLLPPEIPWRGYVIGGALYQTDGSQYSTAELKSLAQQLGISSSVGFTGFVDQPASAMRALDIVVHASTQPEPFGLVIVEAMACGRAVILSSAGGAAELMDSHAELHDRGANAMAHTPGDTLQLAERLKQLATDAPFRARLGAAGRITVETNFNRRRLATELIPIYGRVITDRRSQVDC